MSEETTQTLALADLIDMSEQEIKAHISENYAGSVSRLGYARPTDDECSALLNELDKFNILIAYESVGSWGCDSESWFLLQDKASGALFENRGSHCSCYGFEGQWEPEETTFEYVASDEFYFSAGGYDDDRDSNELKIREYARAAIAKATQPDDDRECPDCRGTGEGQFEGKSCGACRGRGYFGKAMP